ncbi:MAG: TlyA family RNA methyltransferase [Nitrospirota bacterium]
MKAEHSNHYSTPTLSGLPRPTGAVILADGRAVAGIGEAVVRALPRGGKERLDILLLERGMAKSREAARGLILSGAVFVDGQKIDKAGTPTRALSEIVITQKECPYVSRGGIKMAAAIEAFSIDVSGKVAIDVGASTGGFTDCLLQLGALRVYAIDVGYGQLAESLRKDPRVIVLDRQNIRTLPEGIIPEKADIAVIDVSFISLDKVIPDVLPLLVSSGEIIALVKPQFEVGKGEVGKGGIVRDDQQHQVVLEKIFHQSKTFGLTVSRAVPSPITGKKGNREFLVHLKKEA